MQRDAGALDALAPDAEGIDGTLARRLDELPAPYKPPAPVIRKRRHGDCSTSYAPRPDRDPNPMCKVTGGTFMMGGGHPFPERGGVGSIYPTPVEAAVGDFFIDQFEVTAQQAALFLNAHGNDCPGLDDRPDSDVNPCLLLGEFGSIESRKGRFVPVPGRELAAVEDFTWEGAMRYCAWVGKKVPSNAQWEYAARHDPRTGRDLRYSWGDEWLPKHAWCVIRDACPLPRGGAPTRPLVGGFDGTRGFGDGSSPWGAHDMTGGARELVFACTDPEATCEPGKPCSCRRLQPNPDGIDVAEMATWNRIELRLGMQGVRCVSSVQ
ncbi:MAG: formylglycine-generating enzyme family protein [Kofleriaceae bacterium]